MSASTSSARLWLWFGAGFLSVFVAMALCVTMYTTPPSGIAVVACPLWKYYAIDLRRQLGPAVLGPASGRGSGLIETMFFHVVISLLGGGALVEARLLVRGSRRGGNADGA
ncbi:MAG: hypothetical protein ACLQLG_03165 [Thermoguttaceae bacterium]